MIVYEATKQQFLHDTDNDGIDDVILARFTARAGKRVGRLEINAWNRSLGDKYLAKSAAPRTGYELVGSITRTRFSHMLTGSRTFVADAGVKDSDWYGH
ncbi:hypothetical protein ACMYUJ_19370 [Stutzerimonas zhaodongensis]|uniref:hypothetical protein n=1 Tax=Stutzerimonas zhaodongensis TaxID=1176257 RepID=UPI0039F05F8F